MEALTEQSQNYFASVSLLDSHCSYWNMASIEIARNVIKVYTFQRVLKDCQVVQVCLIMTIISLNSSEQFGFSVKLTDCLTLSLSYI